MLLVTVVCSDPDCAQEREVAVEDLDGLEHQPCECGHGFVVVAVAELDQADDLGAVISLPKRRRPQTRRAA